MKHKTLKIEKIRKRKIRGRKWGAKNTKIEKIRKMKNIKERKWSKTLKSIFSEKRDKQWRGVFMDKKLKLGIFR